MKKKRQIPTWGKIVIGVLVALGIIGGGISMYQYQEKQYMINTVNSSKSKQVIKKSLQYFDSSALEKGGAIQNYDIDYDSVEHNPMGGIMFRLYINKDKNLEYSMIINDYGDGLELSSSGGDIDNIKNMVKEHYHE